MSRRNFKCFFYIWKSQDIPRNKGKITKFGWRTYFFFKNENYFDSGGAKLYFPDYIIELIKPKRC